MRRSKHIVLALFAAAGLLLAAGHVRAQDSDSAEAQSDVLAYLDGTIDWYRAIQALRLTPDSAQEAIILQGTQRDALKILRGGFDYAYAEAAVLEPVAADADMVQAAQSPNSSHLAAFQKNTADNLSAIQKQIGTINRQLATARGPVREKLVQQRDALTGALGLTQAQSDLLTNIKGFLVNPKTSDQSFAGAIKTLERAFPELKPGESGETGAPGNAAAKAATTAATATAMIPFADTADAGKDKEGDDPSVAARQTSGIIAAVSDFLPLWQRGRQVDLLISQLDALMKTNDTLRTDLRTDLTSSAAQGRAMAVSSGVTLPPAPDTGGSTAPVSAPPTPSAPTAADFDKLTARFKLLSAAVVPLGQQHQALETARAELVQWRAVLTHEFTSSLVRLVVRLTVLTILIGVLLGASELSRRAANRLVKDTRRRRQLRTVRRAIVSTIICIVVFLSLFAEVGSLATYVGLLTAGVAVALQQVILSLFAYLFFFGRFGMRVGERVTIGGVTGEVIEAGLLRVYLMEIVDGRPTGRVAIFPNLVFFQPGAAFKQIADTSYGWQELSYSFAPGSDQKAVRDALLAAAGTVYAGYQDAIRRQQTMLESTTHLHIELPQPVCVVQTTERGLIVTLRFPVEPGQEEAIGQKMSEAIEATLQAKPQFQRLAGDAPATT